MGIKVLPQSKAIKDHNTADHFEHEHVQEPETSGIFICCEQAEWHHFGEYQAYQQDGNDQVH